MIQPKKNKDPRVNRTKNLLVGALIDLAQSIGLASISVKQLTDLADVSRVTFYRHYLGMPDFLDQTIDDALARLQQPPHTVTFRDNEIAMAYYTKFFDSVKAHEAFFKAMLGRNGLPEFRQKFYQKRRPPHIAMVRRYRSEFNASLNEEVMTAYFLSAQLGLIEYWLTEGTKYSSRYMAEQFTALTYDRVLINLDNNQP